jgi:UDP-N-acetylglucosamine 2-epimerase (non-hydrolysing)
MHRISIVFGTRPEAIKLCPLAVRMRTHASLTPHVCATAQHRELLDQVLAAFAVQPDVDLALMQPRQTLGSLTSRAMCALDAYLAEQRPSFVVVQGDTTTTFCAALCAFYHRIPVGHVEAGLRTYDKTAPYPEEMNRLLTTRLADLHFPPTAWSRDNLLREGVPAERIIVTGNTAIDALFDVRAKLRDRPDALDFLPETLRRSDPAQPLIVITAHRRESFGAGMEAICDAIATLARRYPLASFVYPVHRNPNVQEPVFRRLAALPNVHLLEPLAYVPFVALLERATPILTDSGGIQEEAPSLGKPVLVLRDTTERPEGIEAGVVRLVGTRADSIVSGVVALLESPAARAQMTRVVNPYGDGHACERILEAIAQFLDRQPAIAEAGASSPKAQPGAGGAS